ncbi:MAG: hypothetical protein U0Y68_06735 [Blastocatellia bacterium]
MATELNQPEQNVVPSPQEEFSTEASRSFEQGLVRLQEIIGYEFHDLAFLRRALTHRSFANEQPEPRPLHNEALGFLGDAVLEFLVSAGCWNFINAKRRHAFQTAHAFVVGSPICKRTPHG